MSDPLRSLKSVAQWLTKFAFHLNWLPFTMSSISPNSKSASKYLRRSLKPAPLRLNLIYLTLSNPSESWIPRKELPEERRLKCTKFYGITTPKKKQLGKQNLVFNKISQTSFKPIPKSNRLIFSSFESRDEILFREEGCDNQVIRYIDTRLSLRSMCLLWYLCIVKIIKSIFVISIEYRSLSVD
jgi:hypothetical protein